jgi:hypothetical protein
MEYSLEFDISDFMNATDEIQRKLAKNLEETMHDAVDDLIRISSNIAPIKVGTLRKSWKKEVKGYLDTLVGVVTYSAIEESKKYGRFNYALWTHEYMDNSQLGPRSRSSNGTDGYSVGNKYLSRPLYGEAKKYLQWFNEAVKRSLDE